MIFSWYKIFNTVEFEALGLVSRTYEYYLEDLGLKSLLVTKGNYLGITVDDTFLCVNMNSQSPFIFDDQAIYRDVNNDVWYGVAIDD